MKHVCLENITKFYGDVRASDHVNLDIEEHGFVTLLGPSGSGKTTILMIVAGFVKQDVGKVLIDGEDIIEVEGERRPAYGEVEKDFRVGFILWTRDESLVSDGTKEKMNRIRGMLESQWVEATQGLSSVSTDLM